MICFWLDWRATGLCRKWKYLEKKFISIFHHCSISSVTKQRAWTTYIARRFLHPDLVISKAEYQSDFQLLRDDSSSVVYVSMIYLDDCLNILETVCSKMKQRNNSEECKIKMAFFWQICSLWEGHSLSLSCRLVSSKCLPGIYQLFFQ